MGNTQNNTQTAADFLESLRVVQKFPGGLTLLEEVSTGNEYALNDIVSNDSIHFESLKASVEKRKAQKHHHVMALRQVQTRIQKNFCSDDYRLSLLIEHPFRNFLDEIEERRITKDFFTENELWSVLLSCASGLQHIYGYGGKHQSLCTATIYITKTGITQIADPLLLSHHANTQSAVVRTNKHVYLSPEQIKMIEDPKEMYSAELSDIFTLGVILLEIATLEFHDQLYEGTELITKISQKLQVIQQKYGKKLAKVLENMLQSQPNCRIKFESILSFIQKQVLDGSNNKEKFIDQLVGSRRMNQIKPSKVPVQSKNITKCMSTNESNFDRTLENKSQQSIQKLNGDFSVNVQNSENLFSAVPSPTASLPQLTLDSYNRPPFQTNISYPYSTNTNFGHKTTDLMNQPYIPYSSSFLPPLTTYFEPKRNVFEPINNIGSSRDWTSLTYSNSYVNTSNSLYSQYSGGNLFIKGISDKVSPAVILTSSFDTNKENSPDQGNRDTAPLEQRLSPCEQDSFSPVQQLQTPQRKSSKQANNSNPNPSSGSSQSNSQSIGNAHIYPGTLAPNSTIIQVNESESSSSSLIYQVEEYIQGSRYEGQKFQGLRHGFGRFYYQDGGFYEGQWKNNKMSGFGKLYYQNGDLAYEGFWRDDLFHGKGKVFNDNPKKFEGSFDYTNLSGLDECWIYYEGEFEEDSKHGPGKVKLSNEEIFEGEFRRDVIQGEGRFYAHTGVIIHGIWRDNRLFEQLQ